MQKDSTRYTYTPIHTETDGWAKPHTRTTQKHVYKYVNKICCKVNSKIRATAVYTQLQRLTTTARLATANNTIFF